MEERELFKDSHINLPIKTIKKIKDLVKQKQFVDQSDAIRYLLNAGIELLEKKNLCKDKEFVESIIPESDFGSPPDFSESAEDFYNKLPEDLQDIIGIIASIKSERGRKQLDQLLKQLSNS